LAVASLLLAEAAPARADISLLPGNNPQPPEANVQLTNGEAGTVIAGTTDTSPATTVNISSSQFLYEQGSGQANVLATSTLGDPKTQVGLTNFTIALAPSQSISAFGDLIFNAQVTKGQGEPGAGGTATISGTALTSAGASETFSFSNLSIGSVGNGQNYFTLLASNGEHITSATLSMTSGDFTALKDVRLSGLAGAPVVPEPSSAIVAALSALGFAGYFWRRGGAA